MDHALNDVMQGADPVSSALVLAARLGRQITFGILDSDGWCPD